MKIESCDKSSKLESKSFCRQRVCPHSSFDPIADRPCRFFLPLSVGFLIVFRKVILFPRVLSGRVTGAIWGAKGGGSFSV